MTGINLVIQNNLYESYQLNFEKKTGTDDSVYKTGSRDALVFNKLLVHLKTNTPSSVFIPRVNIIGQDVNHEYEHFYRAFKYIMAYEDVAYNI
jgi:hypothetical protein